MQTRTFQTRVETREDDGKKRISGYFAVFDGTYELPWGDYESIGRHAFDNTVGGDVRALINHNTTLVIGRTVNGTLLLRVDERGLWGEIDINEADSDAVNLYERVRRGDVSGCSFGFDIVKESYTIDPDKRWHWVLEEVELYEVSPCTFPAYPDTSISAGERQMRSEDAADLKRRKYEHWKYDIEERIKSWH